MAQHGALNDWHNNENTIRKERSAKKNKCSYHILLCMVAWLILLTFLNNLLCFVPDLDGWCAFPPPFKIISH